MNVLLVTHSSNTGLNFRQIMEVENLIRGKDIEISKITELDKPEKIEIGNVDKIIMIVPEWNGSFPWTFKKMIDDSGWPSKFQDKEILLMGTSNSSFGNIMGITHLQHILEWCDARVYHKKICIPNIQNKFSNNNIEIDQRMNSILREFMEI